MVLSGIPDGFPETAHSVHAQRSRVEETDRIPAADEGSRAHPPTPTAPPVGRRPPALPPGARHVCFVGHEIQQPDFILYKSCIYPVACIIIVMYVDNNGVRHNCHELLAEFQSDVAKDGRIDLHLEGDMSSFLSVRYLNNTETGEITADQEAYIDTLLGQYNMTECNPNKVPLKTSVNLDEIAARLPRTPHPEVVSL